MPKLRFGLAAVALASLIGTASAQNTTPDTTTAPADKSARDTPAAAPADKTAPDMPAAAPADNKPARDTSANATNPPMPGANSFTEAQARERIAAAGFQEVKDLKKDNQGVWRGMAKKGDTQVNVALDFRGNVVQE